MSSWRSFLDAQHGPIFCDGSCAASCRGCLCFSWQIAEHRNEGCQKCGHKFLCHFKLQSVQSVEVPVARLVNDFNVPRPNALEREVK